MDLDFHEMAIRVAAHSVEARKRARSKKRKKGKGKSKGRSKRETQVRQPMSELRERERERTSRPLADDDMLRPTTEYSCRLEFSVSADFEGQVPKDRLVRKLKAEMTASVRAAMGIVARDFGLESTGVQVQPVRVEVAMNDQG